MSIEGLGNRLQFPLFVTLELHEDQVPDLHVAGFVLTEWLVFSGLRCFDAHVIENLGAWAARAGIAHGPEVVLHSQLMDPLWRHMVAPKLVGFLVSRNPFLALEDGDVEFFLGESKPLRRSDQLPGECDRFALEVIAEAEVAQHLEEGMVTASEADILQVVVFAAGAHNLLRCRGAVVIAALGPEEDIFELVHPRIGKKQSGVVRRNQRGRVDASVTLRSKKAQEGFPDLITRAVLHFLSLEHHWPW